MVLIHFFSFRSIYSFCRRSPWARLPTPHNGGELPLRGQHAFCRYAGMYNFSSADFISPFSLAPSNAFSALFSLFFFFLSDDVAQSPYTPTAVGSRGWEGYHLLAADVPAFIEQDVFFVSIEDMRADWYLFSECAGHLFSRWAPFLPAPLIVEATNVCSREILRRYMLSPPFSLVLDANVTTRFWIAAWWRRVYGPLVSLTRLFKWIGCSPDPYGRYSLAMSSRLGPGLFEYLDPKDYCWTRDLVVTLRGLHAAHCLCDGFW